MHAVVSSLSLNLNVIVCECGHERNVKPAADAGTPCFLYQRHTPVTHYNDIEGAAKQWLISVPARIVLLFILSLPDEPFCFRHC